MNIIFDQTDELEDKYTRTIDDLKARLESVSSACLYGCIKMIVLLGAIFE